MGAHPRRLGLIDWAQNEQLCTDVGLKQFDEIMVSFFEEGDEMASILRGACNKVLTRPQHRALHFFHGAAPVVGFDALGLQIDNSRTKALIRLGEKLNFAEIVRLYDESKKTYFAGRPDTTKARMTVDQYSVTAPKTSEQS